MMGHGAVRLEKTWVLGREARKLARKAVGFCKRCQNGFWLGGFRYVENPVENSVEGWFLLGEWAVEKWFLLGVVELWRWMR